MISSENERRQHKRYDIAGYGFALIRSDDIEVLGSIKDISVGGLSLSHIDDCENIAELTALDIDLISEELSAENFNGRSIWSENVEGGFSTAMVKMKCCGIQFGQLNNELRVKLNTFIESLSKLSSK